MPQAKDPAREQLLRLFDEPLERFCLPNGFTVLLRPERSLPIASVQVWVRTGSIHEGQHLGAGLSHYLEHMLFKGTSKRSCREISAEVQSHGGSINAYTTFDRTVYHIDIPSEHLGLAVDLLADMVLCSTLPEEEVLRERDVILREIDMVQDEPDSQLWQAVFEAAFREHPYRHPVIGHRAVFERMTRAELLSYYQARYTPNNSVLVVAGDVDAAALRALAERHFGSHPRRALEPVFVPQEPPQLGPRLSRLEGELQLSRCAVCHQIPGLAHPDTPVLDVLASILGAGASSLLWRELREERRLVHSIGASVWNPGTSGLFCVSLECDPAKRAEALVATRSVLAAAAARRYTRAEVEKVIRQAVMGEIHSRRTVSGLAARLGAAEVVVGDLGYPRAYFEKLLRVRSEDLRRAAEAYLRPERETAVELNPSPSPAAEAAPRKPQAKSAPVRRATTFEETVLPGGARILLHEEPRLPLLHLRVVLRGGPSFESPSERGGSALVGTLLTRDAGARRAFEVDQAIEGVGGAFFASCGLNTLGLAAEVLPADLDLALDLIGSGLYEPRFSKGTLGIEREGQLAGLRDEMDDVVSYGRRLLREQFFGAHPLASGSHGTLKSVAALDASSLRRIWARLLAPRNIVVAVAGDFRADKLRPKLESLLARTPRVGFTLPHLPHQPPAAHRRVVTQPREQTVVYHAYPGPGLLSADESVAEVAHELFNGLSSHLFERVRDQKGLAYFVRSGRILSPETGCFYFECGTAAERHREVEHELIAEVARVAGGGVSRAELNRCQSRLVSARRMSLQSNGARALHAGLNAIYGRPVDDLEEHAHRVRAVTVDDLAQFANRWLRPQWRQELVVLPAEGAGEA